MLHGSLNVPIEHHPTIRYMVYNGYYKVMSNIPKMGQLPTPVHTEPSRFGQELWLPLSRWKPIDKSHCLTSSHLNFLVPWHLKRFQSPDSCGTWHPAACGSQCRCDTRSCLNRWGIPGRWWMGGSEKPYSRGPMKVWERFLKKRWMHHTKQLRIG